MYQNSYTLTQISGLIIITYVVAVIWSIGALGMAFITTSLIPHPEGRSTKDVTKCKIAFWLIGVGGAVSFYLFNLFFVSGRAKGLPAQDQFFFHLAVSGLLLVIIYIVLGFLFGKTMLKNHKFGRFCAGKRG